MRTLATLDDLTALISSNASPLYIRTSTGIANDRKMGCSTNHASGQREPGISVTDLMSAPSTPAYLAGQVHEWGYIGPCTYILTGDVIGNGADGEPVLDPETWQPVAYVNSAAIDREHQGACAHPRIDWYTDCGFCGYCNARLDKTA